jgi:hypothetical protein
MIIIGIILVIVLLLLLRLYTIRVREGYVSGGLGAADIRTIRFCPGKSVFYTNQKGDDICCDGVVNGSRCEGKKVCTFGEGRNGLPNCSEIQSEYMSTVATRYCPVSMPYYYEVHDGTTATKGCNSKGYKKGTYEPADGSAYCIIYKTDKCVSPGCTKFIRRDATSGLPMVMQMFNVPGETAPRTCILRDSADKLPDKSGVGAADICDIAVKKYIEKRVM